MTRRDRETCRSLFQNRPADHNKFVSYLAEEAPGGCCEAWSVSNKSVGIVENGEALLRIAFHPFHFDSKTGELTEALVYDAFNKGMSVMRMLSPDQLAEIKETAKLLHREACGQVKARVPKGLVPTIAEKIRAIRNTDGDQAFRIYDTASTRSPLHADVCAAHPADLEKSRRKNLADDLFEVFGPMEAV